MKCMIYEAGTWQAHEMERMTVEELEAQSHDYITRMFAGLRGREPLVTEGARSAEMQQLLHDGRQEMFHGVVEHFRKYVIGEAKREDRWNQMDEALGEELRTYSNVGIDRHRPCTTYVKPHKCNVTCDVINY